MTPASPPDPASLSDASRTSPPFASPFVRAVNDHAPEVDPTAWVAPGAVLVGNVRVLAEASVFYQAVLRAETDEIEVGRGSNVQDGVIVHVDEGFPVCIGEGVSIGHRAVVHGAIIEDGCLIGMGATLLNGSRIGAESLVAAGAVVLEGTEVPPGSLVAGIPAKVRRALNDDERAELRRNAATYEVLREFHRNADEGTAD